MTWESGGKSVVCLGIRSAYKVGLMLEHGGTRIPRVVARIMAPQIYPFSNPWNLCIDCLQGRRDCADVIRVLRWGEYPGWSRWAQCNHRVLRRGKQESQRRKCVNRGKARGMRPRTRKPGPPLGAGKVRNRCFPSLQKKGGSTGTLI